MTQALRVGSITTGNSLCGPAARASPGQIARGVTELPASPDHLAAILGQGGHVHGTHGQFDTQCGQRVLLLEVVIDAGPTGPT